ncbi:hypothetical protein EPO44_03005 [bacterium]|nr:MAG: hypothetical protein EPO44_03005 [bacterium]
MDLIKELWRGDVPLSTAFWRFGFGVNFLLNAAFLYLNFQPDILTTAIGMIFFLLLLLFFIVYGPFILIAIWRSANKYQGFQRNAVAAKIVVILGWGRYLQSLAEFAKEFSG